MGEEKRVLDGHRQSESDGAVPAHYTTVRPTGLPVDYRTHAYGREESGTGSSLLLPRSVSLSLMSDDD
uniref:Uncharacterized protein n=1 Tax=Oryza meridionalis TaxID=40149 RepID=A0A0E0DKN5_9ORYZ